MNYQLLTSHKAFTLIELLVVISIIAIITSFSAAAFSSYSRHQQLVQAQESVDLAIHDAQSRALSSVDGLNWGVHLTSGTNQLSLFSTATGFNSATKVLPRNLGEGTIVSDLTLQSTGMVNVVFSVRDGSVTFTANDGTCLGGSADSSCSAVSSRCLAVGINLQGTADKRYLKVNERNIFEGTALAPCP